MWQAADVGREDAAKTSMKVFPGPGLYIQSTFISHSPQLLLKHMMMYELQPVIERFSTHARLRSLCGGGYMILTSECV